MIFGELHDALPDVTSEAGPISRRLDIAKLFVQSRQSDVAAIGCHKTDAESWCDLWQSIFVKCGSLDSGIFVPRDDAAWDKLCLTHRVQFGRLTEKKLGEAITDIQGTHEADEIAKGTQALAMAKSAQLSDASGKAAVGKGILVEYLVDHKLRAAKAEESGVAAQWFKTCGELMESIAGSASPAKEDAAATISASIGAMIEAVGAAPEGVTKGSALMTRVYPNSDSPLKCILHLATGLATKQLVLDHVGAGNVGLHHLHFKSHAKDPRGLWIGTTLKNLDTINLRLPLIGNVITAAAPAFLPLGYVSPGGEVALGEPQLALPPLRDAVADGHKGPHVRGSRLARTPLVERHGAVRAAGLQTGPPDHEACFRNRCSRWGSRTADGLLDVPRRAGARPGRGQGKGGWGRTRR